MKIHYDFEEFNAHQVRILKEIIASIKFELENLGLDEPKVKESTFDIAFSMTAIIDSSRVMELNGHDVLPFLGFRALLEDEEVLLANESGSYMHELCSAVVERMFADGSEVVDVGDAVN